MTAQLDLPTRPDLQHELHDLRTPLNQIIGFSEMLQEIAQEEGRHDLLDGLATVCSAGIELTSLLADTRLISLTNNDDQEYWPLVDAVRSPISRVLGFADLILAEPPEAHLSSYNEDIEKIRTAAAMFFVKARASRIVIRIEAARDWTAGTPRQTTSASPESVGRVLIVDDENLNREILCRRLLREGYSSLGVASGHAALEALRKEKFDIILLDIMMPGIGGIEVLQTLKQDETLRHLPVLMLSALSDVDRVARCVELGADDYLPKPVNAILLRARLGACMEKKRLRDHEQASLRELDSEKELLSVTLQSLVDAVVTTDAEGRIVLFNNGATVLTGRSANTARGQFFADVFPIFDRTNNQPAADIAREALQLRAVVDTPSGHTMITPLGERIMAAHAAPIQGHDGGIKGTVVVIRDVTEKEKIAEEVLRSSKLESIGVLAGGLAHDFNNMLTAVIGNLSLLRHGVDPSPDIMHRLDEAEEGALRARDLAQYLLTFAEGGAPLKKVVEPAALLRETTEFVVRGSRVDCDFELPDDLWKVEADPGQFTQAVSNVVMNAAQAMPEGGTIFLSAENIMIEEDSDLTLPGGAYVSISISDMGVGIPAEHLPRIYDPFFTTRNQARGLGLAATYSIIHRHGGLIDVESTPGYGTKVHLLLPAVEVASAPEPSEHISTPGQPAEPLSGQRLQRVLVMDDEASIREVCADLLKLLDYEVVTTSDGAEALAVYHQAQQSGTPFDLIITDLTVPGGMGGAEAMRRLRESGSKVRAIVSSGYSNGPVMSHPAEYGFQGVLPKPYRLHDLEAVLQKVAAAG
ncbi:MAG: response regulator [Chthoniobacterales bacterium]